VLPGLAMVGCQSWQPTRRRSRSWGVEEQLKSWLRRINCDAAKSYPAEGMSREWWQRLKNAFGTASSAFVQASLYQLITAAWPPALMPIRSIPSPAVGRLSNFAQTQLDRRA